MISNRSKSPRRRGTDDPFADGIRPGGLRRADEALTSRRAAIPVQDALPIDVTPLERKTAS
jgi:hypothetical protein